MRHWRLDNAYMMEATTNLRANLNLFFISLILRKIKKEVIVSKL